jgi:hypothetical protein
VSRYWDTLKTSAGVGITSRSGRFVLATDAEWVVIAPNNGSARHLLDIRSTDKGATWTSYDTGIIIPSSMFYDAIADDDGIVHVAYWASNSLYERTRTSYGVWSAAVEVGTPITDISDICYAKSPTTGELALVWARYYLNASVDRIYGKKWTLAGGWDASATTINAAGLSCYIMRCAYAPDGTTVVVVSYRILPSYGIVYWTWGNTTATTVYAGEDIVGNLVDIIVSGTTPHVLYLRKTTGSVWGDELPWILYVDTTPVHATDSVTALARFATRIDGTQLLYYSSFLQTDPTNNGRLKRCVLTGGVPDMPIEYVELSRHYQSDTLTFPVPLSNTEMRLACTGYIGNTLTMQIVKETVATQSNAVWYMGI